MCWSHWRGRPVRCLPVRCCLRTCGATATPPTPVWSMSTFSVCAPRSNAIPRIPRLCSPCAEWGTRPAATRREVQCARYPHDAARAGSDHVAALDAVHAVEGHHLDPGAVSYTHLRAHETDSYLVCRL